VSVVSLLKARLGAPLTTFVLRCYVSHGAVLLINAIFMAKTERKVLTWHQIRYGRKVELNSMDSTKSVNC
jgi:hypothetical protein